MINKYLDKKLIKDNNIIFSDGKISSLDIFKHVCDNFNFKQCIISSYCLGLDETVELFMFCERKKIDINIFLDKSKIRISKHISDLAYKYFKNNLFYISNHSKIMLFKNNNQNLIILGSANFNKCLRIEYFICLFNHIQFNDIYYFFMQFAQEKYNLINSSKETNKDFFDNMIKDDEDILIDLDIDMDFDL